MSGVTAKIKYKAPYHLHVYLARKFITIVMNSQKDEFIKFFVFCILCLAEPI